jgi:hypothetical protein
MKNIVAVIFNLFLFVFVEAQTTPNPRPITMQEYQKAKTFLVKDLDKDTYVKFENAYVLDRYEMRKPYFITGDDGLRKRIDLYKLIAKDGMQELATVIFYTNEKGKMYTAVQPNFTADAKVWEQYFNDIDNINKEEENFILKLSYVLSKEMSFQLYKAINKGRDMKDESATYGTDICFPGNQTVLMADGTKKALEQIKSGDKIISFDPVTNKSQVASVKELVAHPAKNYAVTRLLLLSVKEENGEVYLSAKVIEATPNHPVTTNTQKRIGDVQLNEQMTCWDGSTHSYKTYTVISKEEKGKGSQKVYNMIVDKGSTFVMNDVLVLQK